MIPAGYHDFFVGCGTVAGALIGLLFVALSISPQKLTGEKASTDYQAKAGAALSALTNTLVIALVALLPGASLSTAVTALAAAGLATTASLIILLYREHKRRIRLGQVVLPVVLLILYGLQLANGFQLSSAADETGHLTNLGGLAIVFFLFAITRAWQLVGARDTNLLLTVAEVSRAALLNAQPQPSDEAAKTPPPDEPGPSLAELRLEA